MESSAHTLFVSYKRENANMVRSVCEALMAEGLRIWFAEYKVLLTNYTQFQNAINQAIDRTSFGLIFANDAWATSEYCQMEIARLMHALPSERILQVHAPMETKAAGLINWIGQQLAGQPTTTSASSQQHPSWVDETLLHQALVGREATPAHLPIDVSRMPSMEFQGDIAEVIGFVARHAGRVPRERSLARYVPTGNRRWRSRRFGLSLQCGGFQPRDIGPESALLTLPGFAGLFRATVDGHQVSMLLQASPEKSAVSDLWLPPECQNDDRALYDLYRRYARSWISDLEGRVHGLHVFRWQGAEESPQNHMALTYSYAESDSQTHEWWERRYAIAIAHPNSSATTELGVLFSMRLPRRDVEENLGTFCRIGACFESIVESIRYAPPRRMGEIGIVALLTRGSLLALALLLLSYVRTSFDGLAAMGAGAIVGLLGVDFLVLLFCPDALKKWLLIGASSDRVNRDMSLYERLSNEWYDSLWVAIIWSWMVVRRGVVDWFGVLPLAIGLFFRLDAPVYWIAAGAALSVQGNVKLTRQFARVGVPLKEAEKHAPGAPRIELEAADPLVPVLEMRRAGAISPHLPRLLAELRENDRGYLYMFLRPWAFGHVLAGLAGWFGDAEWGIGVAVVVQLLLVGSLLVSRRLAVPATIAPLLRRFAADPTSQNAMAIARAYNNVGQRGGVVNYLSLAVQWACLAAQMCPDDVSILENLTWYASSLGRAMSHRSNVFPEQLAARCLEVGRDALEHASSALDSSHLQRMFDHLDSCRRVILAKYADAEPSLIERLRTSGEL